MVDLEKLIGLPSLQSLSCLASLGLVWVERGMGI